MKGSPVAAITGAGRGLGKATALVLAERGYDVILADVDADQAETTARAVADLGRQVLVQVTDVGSRASVETLGSVAEQRFGSVDVLVNNAAVIAPALALEMTDEQWDRVLDVGLKGVFLCSQVFGRIMVRQRRGAIVNIASVAAERGIHGRANYCAAKAGVVALTRVLAAEWAPFGVRVNAVGPGYINTELQQQALEQGLNNLESLTRVTPLGRLAEPHEIARVIAFLASPEASYVTGQTVFADGGWLSAAPR